MTVSGMASAVATNGRNGKRRKTYARIPDILPIPDLIKVQIESYEQFKADGLRELFDEISPIESFNGNLKLYFPGSNEEFNQEWGLDFRFEEATYTQEECRERDTTYAAPLYVKVLLDNRDAQEPTVQVQEVYMGDFPIMTENGTFIVNGAERVVVSQLIRSPGAYFTVMEDRATGRQMCMAKLIPNRGAWLEFETSRRDLVSVKVDRKRKIPVTVLLRALGAVTDETGEQYIQEGTDEELLELFATVDNSPDHQFIRTTLEHDTTNSAEEALEDFYRKMRPGDPATLENARTYLEQLLFSPRRYDLGKVGRYKLNRRIGLEAEVRRRTLSKRDIVSIVQHIIRVNNGVEDPDDIDHLGNRRVKTMGELLQNQLRVGFLRMERVVRERMSIRDPEQVSPVSLINIRPVVAVVREFFGGSQLSQFMQQVNPLDELTHKRTLSALGPGGLRRERAGFDVRDVHFSHYGRICPIETPEGPNIGLIGRLATFAEVNEYGFIETPYREVQRVANVPAGQPVEAPFNAQSLVGTILCKPAVDEETGEVLADAGQEITEDVAQLLQASSAKRVEVCRPTESDLLWRTVREPVTHPETGEILVDVGEQITEDVARRLVIAGAEQVRVQPFVTDKIRYLSADEEDQFVIAQANTALDEYGNVTDERVSARVHDKFVIENVDRVSFMDVSPKQVVGVSAALIPFLEHDDANRALMGSNMQRQAVPLLMAEAPLVGTGMEYQAAIDSGQVLTALRGGKVVSASGSRVIIQSDEGQEDTYHLRKFERSNQSTCIDQHAVVAKGDRVEVGDVIGDSSSTEQGELALGQNVLAAFMSWEGGNYEDAILVSEQLVREDKFSSIHIEKHETEARDTKLGPEEITRDIPNVGEDVLENLDEEGVIYVGARVGPGDVLVGKITPKGETELTPEEKLLRAIFGEKAREVKDSSLRLPHGEEGKVVDVHVFTRDDHRDMAAGVEKMVRVGVAQLRKLAEGDKMAGRHGNKGVISAVVPIEDMPYLEDGTSVEIILNPLGVPGRMNVGQILETHLGWAADRLGFRVATPVSDGADENEIVAELARAWLIDRAWMGLGMRAWDWLAEQEIDEETLQDDEDARHLYLGDYLSERGYGIEEVDAILADHNTARRTWLRHWLEEQGYSASEVMVYEDSEQEAEDRDAANDLVRALCLRVWLGDEGVETEDLSDEEVTKQAMQRAQETNQPLPTTGKMVLYDGKTGEPFDRPVTVGIIYMLKLAHLVQDKVHARSTGPYSLVTQQPLGGKAQFGGQRFGEMEVWALEAYGAAHTLQEMLTIKSDDVMGRVKTYEAIVKGEPVTEAGVPESFSVLIKELQALGLSVEVFNETGESVPLVRTDQANILPNLGLGLGLGFGSSGR